MEKLFNLPFDSITWTWFDIMWPWIGLVVAVFIFILLFASNILRHDVLVSRWRDPEWLSWLAIPIYMFHQFEEYGIDFLGKKHAFPDGLCSNLGLGNYPACPIPHEFFLYVNIPLVWFFAVLSAKFSPKNPFVGLGLYSVIISNAMAHIVVAVATQTYNPGLFSAIVIFLPSFFWLCKACFIKGRFRKAGIGVLVATGIILHIILISSVLMFVKQNISGGLLDFIQIINASTIVLLPWLGDSFLKIYSKTGDGIEQVIMQTD
jgi:Protein of unknown function with HXXEE motif